MEVGRREIRGVVSNGMIASARELGLGDDHEGILVLDRLGAASADDVGRPLEDVLEISETVLDVSITTNRGDCMSIRGLARELAAYWQIPLKDVDPRPSCGPGEPDFRVTIEDTEACPRFRGPPDRRGGHRPFAAVDAAAPAGHRTAAHLERRGRVPTM